MSSSAKDTGSARSNAPGAGLIAPEYRARAKQSLIPINQAVHRTLNQDLAARGWAGPAPKFARQGPVKGELSEILSPQLRAPTGPGQFGFSLADLKLKSIKVTQQDGTIVDTLVIVGERSQLHLLTGAIDDLHEIETHTDGLLGQLKHHYAYLVGPLGTGSPAVRFTNCIFDYRETLNDGSTASAAAETFSSLLALSHQTIDVSVFLEKCHNLSVLGWDAQFKRLQIIGCNNLVTDVYGATIDNIFIQNSKCVWLRFSEADIKNQVVIRDCAVRGILSNQETDRISGYRVVRAAILLDNTTIGSDLVIAASNTPGASPTFSTAIFGVISAEGAEVGGDFILSQCLISALLTTEQQWTAASARQGDGKLTKAIPRDCIRHAAVALLLRNAEVRGSLQFWRIGSLVLRKDGMPWEAVEGIDGAVDLDFASVGPWVDDGTIWKRMRAATGKPQSEEWKTGEGRLQIQSFTYATISKNYLSRIRQRKPDSGLYRKGAPFTSTNESDASSGESVDAADTFGLDAGTIREWLSKQSARRLWGDLLNAQGWTHAARILRMQGQYSDANELQFWRSWFYHKSLNPWRRVEDPGGRGESSRLFSSWIEWFYRYLTLPSGYGYFLFPAIAFTLAVIAGGAGVFQIAFDRGLMIRAQEDGKALEPLSGTIKTGPPPKPGDRRNSVTSAVETGPTSDNPVPDTKPLSRISDCGDPLSAPLFPNCEDAPPLPSAEPPRERPQTQDPVCCGDAPSPFPPDRPQQDKRPTAKSCCDVVVTVNGEWKISDGRPEAPYPEFNAFAYSFDVFFPLFDLKQGDFWVPGIPPQIPKSGMTAKPVPAEDFWPSVWTSEPQLWAAASSAARFMVSLIAAISVMIVTSVIFVWTIERRFGFAEAAIIAALAFLGGGFFLTWLLNLLSGGFNLEFVWRQFWLQVALGWYFSAIFTAAINRLWEGKD